MATTTTAKKTKVNDKPHAIEMLDEWVEREGLDTAKLARRLDCSWETAERIRKDETRPDVDAVLVLLDLAEIPLEAWRRP
jgi:hypothetical protein